MTNLIRAASATALAVAVLSGIPVAATAATADDFNPAWEDKRRCATVHEVWITPVVGRQLTRQQVEQRWDVEGLGTRNNPGVWEYPVCDRKARALILLKKGTVLTVGLA